MRPLCYFVLFVTSLFSGIVECVVDLQPNAVEYVCPGANVGRTLTCSVSGSHTEWVLTVNGRSPNTIQFVHANPPGTTQKIMNIAVGTLISGSPNNVTSRLDIQDRPELIPFVVQCGLVNEMSEYSLKYKERPEPPTNIILTKNEGTATSYTVRWQPTSSRSRSADNYTVIITDSSSSLSQTFTTSTSTLSVDLSHNNTNYTLSVKATNCVGDSAETTIHIIKDEAISEHSATSPTTQPTPSSSLDPSITSDLQHTGSMHLTTQQLSSGDDQTGTTSSSSIQPSVGNTSNLFLEKQTLIWILVAVVGVVILATLVIIIMVILICIRRRTHLKSVSMETPSESTNQSTNAADMDIYNKLNAYTDFEVSTKQKHFHNPNYAELNMSSSPTDNKVDQFTHTDHIYHVLEGPDPNASANNQDDTYAEVSGCNGHSYSDKCPDKHSVTPPLEMKQRKPDDSPSAVQIKRHFPSSSDEYNTQTWNFSYH